MMVTRTPPTLSGKVEYYESDLLTNFGGFLITSGDHHQITMSTGLTPKAKQRGLAYLLEILSNPIRPQVGLHIWVGDDPAQINLVEEEQDVTEHLILV